MNGWMDRWPGAVVDRTEVWEGNLVYELRGFSHKEEWTTDDVAAARLVYPEQQVALSPSRHLLFIGPTAEALVERLRSSDEPDENPDATLG